eukprot:764537-Hanusia_phi.AAC.3
MRSLHGARRALQLLILSHLADETTSFLASPLGYAQLNRFKSPNSFACNRPLIYSKQRSRSTGTQLRMEHIGRRYFLWRFAEWAFEKVMLSITLVYNFVKRFKSSAQIESRLYNLRYPTYKAVKAASDANMAYIASPNNPSGELKVGGPSPNLLLFVDFASGSSSGLTIFVRKRLPMPVRRLLAFPRPWIYENKLGVHFLASSLSCFIYLLSAVEKEISIANGTVEQLLPSGAASDRNAGLAIISVSDDGAARCGSTLKRESRV